MFFKLILKLICHKGLTYMIIIVSLFLPGLPAPVYRLFLGVLLFYVEMSTKYTESVY